MFTVVLHVLANEDDFPDPVEGNRVRAALSIAVPESGTYRTQGDVGEPEPALNPSVEPEPSLNPCQGEAEMAAHTSRLFGRRITPLEAVARYPQETAHCPADM